MFHILVLILMIQIGFNYVDGGMNPGSLRVGTSLKNFHVSDERESSMIGTPDDLDPFQSEILRNVMHLPDNSFLYDHQVYGPDCRPVPGDPLADEYPMFKNCSKYIVYVRDESGKILNEYEEECPKGSFFKKLRGCVAISSAVPVPWDCLKETAEICDRKNMPMVRHLNLRSGGTRSKVPFYRFQDNLYNIDCSPMTVTIQTNRRLTSMTECNVYYEINNMGDIKRTQCQENTRFNRLTKECEVGIPCIEYPHFCKRNRV